MTTLGDFDAALQMRDIIRAMVQQELDSSRPDYFYAQVITVDLGAHRATVQQVGQTNTIPVRFGNRTQPTINAMVRVAGNVGDRIITDILGGSSQAEFPGGMYVDTQNQNRGQLDQTIGGAGFAFGAPGSGEGMASDRIIFSNDNWIGLDFYTNHIRRLSVTNAGVTRVQNRSNGQNYGVVTGINGSYFFGPGPSAPENNITQFGTAVATTDTSGQWTHTFPTPFPNGFACMVLSLGNAGAANGWIGTRDSAGTNLSSALCAFQLNATFRYNWIAMGW